MYKRISYLICIVLLLSLTGSASAQLLAHYKFNETSGNIAVDSSIKGNDGIIEIIDEEAEGGDPNWIVDGIDGALGFDGNMDVNLPSENMGLRSDSGTVAFWMKMAEVTGGINTIWWGGDNTTGGGFGSENEMHIHVETTVGDIWIGGEICFHGQSDPNNFHLHSDPNKGDPAGNEPNNPILVNDNQWHHITCTWGNDDGNAKMYFNGRLLHQMARGTRSYPLSHMYLGQMANGSRTYHGLLDDVQIYGRALTVEEIQDVMAAGAALTLPASLPLPANNSGDVPRDTILSWTEGDTAVTHNVYFGTNFDDVNEATTTDTRGVLVSQNQSGLTFDPLGSNQADLLDYGQTYHWRVDEVEVDGVTINKGNIWKFTVANFIVVDDFESYNDLNPEEEGSNRIFNIWTDGWGTTTNGATVGYAEPDFENDEHFVETTTIHTGNQSMPYLYDNDMKYSEAVMSLESSARDWTRDDVNELSLWFIGAPGPVGSFVENPAGTYTMTAAGADICGGADELHFAYKEVTGAVTIQARVDSLDNTDPYAKAGVMIRDTLEPGARNCSLLMTPEYGVRFQYRNIADDITDREFDPNVAVPYWVKLERTAGGLIRARYSPNGNDWTLLPLKQVSMTMPIYIGLAVTSHNTEEVCTAVLSNVTITGTGNTSAWTAQDIGITSNSAQPLYVALNDNVTVYYDDPNATQIKTWTQWNIPLQDFEVQGLNLSNVNKITLGVGTKGNMTTLGGTGSLFFDDIRLYRPPVE